MKAYSLAFLLAACTTAPLQPAKPSPPAHAAAPAPVEDVAEVPEEAEENEAAPDAGVVVPADEGTDQQLGITCPDVRSDWTDAFTKGAFPFSALAVTDDAGVGSVEQRATCAGLRKTLLKPGQSLECFETRSGPGLGLWAILKTEAGAGKHWARWQLVYAPVKGRPSLGASGSFAPITSVTSEPAYQVPSAPVVVALFDVDGDGKKEIFVADTRANLVDGRWVETTLYTVGHSGITVLPTTRKLSVIMIADTDQDGRPELIVDPYQRSFKGTFDSSSRNQLQWSLLYEIGPGGRLVTAGSASKAYARTLCPSAEGLEPFGQLTGYCVAGYAHCARLWGFTTEQVEYELDDFCGRERFYRANRGELGSETCPYALEGWQEMGRRAPPFVLTAP